ncbi:MAG: non-canonical purine NTP pyrophosphatase [Ilumatobacteraceae bacterium]
MRPRTPVLRVACASANPHKVAEIAELVTGLLDLVPRPADVPDVDEHADTLLGNARLKAAAIADATGLPAVADDTGLEVDALGGAPGVRTARFAALPGPHARDLAGRAPGDADNRARLLAELAGVPADRRTARFRTVVVLRWPSGPREVVVEGVCEGRIAAAERGTRGFGYDALFAPLDGDGRTFAEMSLADKHAYSHRGRAFAALRRALTTP